MKLFVHSARFAAGTALVLVAVPSVWAQVPVSLDFPAGPAIVALGGAGAAAHDGGSAFVNPAALASVSMPSLRASAFRTRRIARSGLRLTAGFALPWRLRLGLGLYQKGVSDLIEDPSVNESALKVGHTLVRMGVARGFFSERIAAGVAVTALNSQVLGTTGQALLMDLGLTMRPHPRISIGAALRRVGGPVIWKMPGGVSRSTDLATALRLGLFLGHFDAGPARVGLRADVETGPEMMGVIAGGGIELGFADVAKLRFGLAHPANADFRPGGGLAVRVGAFRFELAYTSADIIGSTVHVGVGVW